MTLEVDFSFKEGYASVHDKPFKSGFMTVLSDDSQGNALVVAAPDAETLGAFLVRLGLLYPPPEAIQEIAFFQVDDIEKLVD